MWLHHVLIDGGAGLNVISHAAFKQLQIPGSRLGPSRPFSRVGPQPVYPIGSIALPVTFGTKENFRTENVVFDVTEVKGKCALGLFLSILVIECKHKCLNVNLCPWMNKVQITSKGMFLSLSTLVLGTNILV
jgi:hypothetical protein